MLLTGTFERNVDEKLRLALPKPLRDALQRAESATVLYMAPGTDGSLALFPDEAFERLADKLANASPNAVGVRSFSRLFFARAQRIEMDKSGRVRIPSELAQLGGICKAIVLVGVRDHIELWDKQLWNAYLDENEPVFDQIAEQAFDANQSTGRPAPPADTEKPLPR